MKFIMDFIKSNFSFPLLAYTVKETLSITEGKDAKKKN